MILLNLSGPIPTTSPALKTRSRSVLVKPKFSISSAQSDANGYGSFEHEPPSGYYAICTKNLAEYGG